MAKGPALTEELIARVVATHPLPIADAVAALSAADSLHERRDRVVETFRAVLRYAAAIALAARVQRGPGPAPEKEQLMALLRGLRSRGLTDGQWVALMRGLLGAWSSAPDTHPVPGLAPLFCGKAKKHLAKTLDGLLEMRKSETVAHGATGSSAAIAKVLQRREPQLADLLRRFEPVWQACHLVVPLALPKTAPESARDTETPTEPNAVNESIESARADEQAPASDEADKPAPIEQQLAFDLHGDTPRQGRWRRIPLAAGTRLSPGEPILIDADGKPLISFYPIALFQRPSPEAVEELFVLDGAKKRAAVFVAFPSMAEYREPDVWGRLGSSLFGEQEPDAAPPSTRGVAQPYRGLSSFGPEHSALFFGREQQAQSLANRIRRHPMITLTGASGSGKSSLLYAGVFPLLEDYDVVQLRPGADPLQGLARQLASSFEGLEPEPLRALLQSEPSALGPRLAQLARDSGRTVVLFVDQGEELFTLCRDETHREAFAQAIASAGSDPDAPSRVVLSLREDYFARIANLSALRGLYARQVEVVATPDRDELTRILIAPAQMFGFMFEDLALVEEMIDRVHGESAALAMLQFCADQLWLRRDRSWKRLTWDAYRSIGGVEGALAAHAEATLDAMTGSQVASARRMLLRLVTAEGTRAVVPKRDLLDMEGAGQDTADVLDRLLSARLLTTRELFTEDEATVVVELVHEALLAHWERLREWLQADVAFVRVRARLEKAASRWDAEERPGDLLLGDGKPLLEARELLEQRRELLRDIEIAFIDASEKRARGVTRLKRAAIAALALLTVLAAGFGVFAWFARGRAEEAADQAAASEKVAVSRSVTLLTEQGRRELLDNRPLRALIFLQDALARGGDSVALHSLLANATRPADALTATLRPAGPSVYWLGYSPDGKQLAVADTDGQLEFFDADSHASIRRLKLAERRVDRIAFTPDGELLIVQRGLVRFVDRSGTEKRRIDAHPKSIMSLQLSQDGQRLATASVDGSAKLWRRDGTLLAELKGHEKSVLAIALSADGRFVATGSRDRSVRIWDATSGEQLHLLSGHTRSVDRVRFAPQNNSRLLSAGHGHAHLWDVESGESVAVLERSQSSIRVARYGPQSVILTAGYDNRGQLWTPDGKPLAAFAGHDDYARGGTFTPASIRDVRFSANGRVLYSRGSDATVRAWDTSTGRRLTTLMAHTDQVGAIAVRPSGAQIASAGLEGAVYLWSAPRGALIDSIGLPAGGHKPVDPIMGHAIDGKAQHIASVHQSGQVTLWSQHDARPLKAKASSSPLRASHVALAENGIFALALNEPGMVWLGNNQTTPSQTKTAPTTLARFKAHNSTIHSVAITRDGAIIATAADDGVKLWQRDKLLHHLQGHESGVRFVTFSADGQRVAGAERGPVRVWDARSGKLLASVPADKGAASLFPRARFSPDGKRIASLTSPLRIPIWDIAPAKQHLVLEGALLDFSPDGKQLILAATNPLVHVLDADSGAELSSLDGHTKRISAVAFCLDGERAVTASDDGTARVWEVSSGKLLTLLLAHNAVDDATVPAAAQRLLTRGDGTLKLWDIGLETRDATALAALAERSSPWRLDHGGLVERTRQPSGPAP